MQSVEVSEGVEAKLFIRATGLPEMRKDRVCKLCVTLCMMSADIWNFESGCPGGKGPSGSSKHIASLCFTFFNFREQGSLQNFFTYTERLQQWNRPCKRNFDPIPVTAIRDHQQTVAPSAKLLKSSRVPMKFDPKPFHLRHPDPQAIETLQTNLSSINQPCAFFTVLVPSDVSIPNDYILIL